jgi:hypothetical protein
MKVIGLMRVFDDGKKQITETIDKYRVVFFREQI